jgi:hypothetical protein
LSALVLIDKPWFLTEGKYLPLCSSYFPLGVSQLPGHNHHQLHASHQVFSGAVAGEEVEDFCKGSFSHAHPLLCFIVFFYFIFTCIIFYQKPKKN